MYLSGIYGEAAKERTKRGRMVELTKENTHISVQKSSVSKDIAAHKKFRKDISVE
jgi:hypothetical protein